MNKNNVYLLIDYYYKEPLKIIFEKLLMTNINCISDINDIYEETSNNIIISYKNYDDTNKQYHFTNNIFNNYKIVKKINNKINVIKYIRYYILIILSTCLINKVQKYIRSNIGFEINDGSFERIEKSFKNNLTNKLSMFSIIKEYHYYMKRLKNLKIDKPKRCINIGILSNDYIPNKLYYDYTVEKILSNKNIYCIRIIGQSYFSDLFVKYKLYKIRKYCKYNIGNKVINNIYFLKKLIKLQYDGIIFIKKDNIIDISTNSLIDSICSKEKIPMISIKFDNNINKINIENNINVLYDLIKLNNNNKMREN